jgi:CRISPR-associated endonuclease/helicase Cas3
MVGRRIFFTVNRRVIVDEAFNRAHDLAHKLLKAEENNDTGILGEVARALRSLNGESDPAKAPPLDRLQLRGGIYRDRAWARSITQPIVVCTTADQIGSRLLFRGYGVSSSMQPVHAALAACDSLILLDEAHVTKAFSQTLGLLKRYREQDKTSPPMRFVEMTATPANQISEDERFSLKKENWNDPLNQKLKERQEGGKRAELVLTGKKSIIDEIVKRAVDVAGGPPKAIGIIVNRVQTARDIHAKLVEKYGEDVHLIIGRMRPIDRDILQGKLRDLVGPARPDVFPADAKSVLVVATQCLEVGADYDFDALLTECASVDALRQRFGRLNRRGRKLPDGKPIEVTAAIVTNDASLKNEDPIYGNALKNTWDWLQSKKDALDHVDFGISMFKPLWEEVEKEPATYLDEDSPKRLLSPAQNAAVLLPAHLDALCQTNPQPMPSPDVSFFIHGPQRDNAEVNVCWRADLGDDETLWPDIVRLLPPTSPECMTVPLTAVRKWLDTAHNAVVDADVPINLPEVSDEKSWRSESPGSLPHRMVVTWRGWKDVDVVDAPNKIRPNDTIVIRTQDFGWESMGHIPNAPIPEQLEALHGKNDAPSVKARAEIERLRDLNDIAERATSLARRRVAIRRHPAIIRDIDPEFSILGKLNAEELRERFTKLKEFLEINFDWLSTFKRRPYPGQSEDAAVEAITFDQLLKPKDKLELPVVEDDEGIGESTDAAGPVTLVNHTTHVVKALRATLAAAKFAVDHPTVTRSAELHDIGKSDIRFNAMLRACTPGEVLERGSLLGKSGQPDLTRMEFQQICRRAMYPSGFRHEMLSVDLIVNTRMALDASIDRSLLLHLIASHHGEARPFASVVMDEPTDEELRSKNLTNFHDRRSIELDCTEYWPSIKLSGEQRADENNWIPSHRLDSGVGERFWMLTREHGWWGLAWLESILRLADQQASAAEQEGKSDE